MSRGRLFDRNALPERTAGCHESSIGRLEAARARHRPVWVRPLASTSFSGTAAERHDQTERCPSAVVKEMGRFPIPFPVNATGGGSRYRERDAQSACTTVSPSKSGPWVHADCEVSGLGPTTMAPTLKISVTVLREVWFPIDLRAQGHEPFEPSSLSRSSTPRRVP